LYMAPALKAMRVNLVEVPLFRCTDETSTSPFFLYFFVYFVLSLGQLEIDSHLLTLQKHPRCENLKK